MTAAMDPFSIEVPELLQRHFDMLCKESRIAVDLVRERGYRSILGSKELEHIAFSRAQRRQPGLLVPVWSTDGKNGLHQYRPDHPRQSADGRAIKYETPLGAGLRLDCPPRCRAMLADPEIPLWLTEGVKKADAFTTHKLCVVALLGVWNFKGKNELGGVTFLNDWDYIALNGRTVNVVYDSDVMTIPDVAKALARLTQHLQRKGANVNAVYLPGSRNGFKVGVDDYLITHTLAELEELVQAPKPQPKPAAPQIELLEEVPPILSRPMQLIEGRGYAVTWLWVRTTTAEAIDKRTGDVIRLNEPVVTTERRQFVIRDDGVTFGDGGDKSFDELCLQVSIPTMPRDVKLWTAKGIKSYRKGDRPPPRDVFGRLVSLIDRYMSFDRSLADQNTMCELVACYSLATWFLDAFDVTGFLWPNGGYGTGKTKLGMLVCEVAYLGEVLLSGSTYACLRDLADLGATLLFDDVEALADPKKTDPDKRNLLLAGNRRGTTVTVKEPGPDGTWKTRYVNAYCPRLFTAIRMPDTVLASRTIVVPLVRTADPKKANAEVLDYSQWPCDRRQLLDDLWALALTHLRELPTHEAAVNADAPLVGRNLEPWRAVLSVGHWLAGLGETDLYKRMCELAKAYQTERTELEAPDLTRLVVRAMIEVVTLVTNVTFVTFESLGRAVEVDVSDIAAKVNEFAVEEGLAEENGPDYTTAKKVGRVLKSLRIREGTRTAKRRKRQITMAELNGLARSYGISDVVTFDTTDGDLSLETSQTSETSQVDETEELANGREVFEL